MSQAGGPSQEVARGIIPFVADLSAIEQAKRDVERHADEMGAVVKEKLGGAFRDVFDEADRRLAQFREAASAIQGPTTRQPAVSPSPDPTQRAMPDPYLPPLESIKGTLTTISETVSSINDKIQQGP